MKLKKEEKELIGHWRVDGMLMKLDDVSQRIKELTESHLLKIATDESGWKVLYKDQEDGRFWELVYSESQMHGGGAPTLVHLSEAEAKESYMVVS
ncbi:Imm27 family immunity protein [Rufibacter sediminis]|nr:Imm27 family immunity protein [Rufibacter sediminis]